MYARQAQNREAERKACEIRLRAERRAGDLLRQMAREGRGHSGHGNNQPQKLESADTTPTLSDLGISRDQSSEARKPSPLVEKVVMELSREVVFAWVDAFNRRDAHAAAALYHATRTRSISKSPSAMTDDTKTGVRGKDSARHPVQVQDAIPRRALPISWRAIYWAKNR
jgi:hypothetical protein